MVDRVLRLPEVIQTTGLCKTAIYAGISAGTFPKQLKLGQRSSGWLESSIQQWINERAALANADEVA